MKKLKVRQNVVDYDTRFQRKLETVFLVIITLLIFFPSVAAIKSGSATLLAVTESVNGTLSPSQAEISLEVRRGTGKVYLDTIPFSRVDTQVSARFAKEMACKYLDFESRCTQYDFYYTIRAPTNLVGGPSGGALISALTVLVLDGKKFDASVAITGTINSGGLIGPVGGVKEKIESAKSLGLRLVLIPTDSRFVKDDVSRDNLEKNDFLNQSYYVINQSYYVINQSYYVINQSYYANNQSYYVNNQSINVTIKSIEYSNESGIFNDSVDTSKWAVINDSGMSSANSSLEENSTFIASVTEVQDLVFYGRTIGIEVKTVDNLDDIIFELTGKRKVSGKKTIEISSDYIKTMSEIKNKLCKESYSLLAGLNINITELEIKKNLDNLSNQHSKNTNNYSINSDGEVDLSVITKEKKILLDVKELLLNADIADEEGKLYSAASFCFASNIQLKFIELMRQNISSENLSHEINSLNEKVTLFNIALDSRQQKTIIDLQTKMIVKERVVDAYHYLEQANESLLLNDTESALFQYAYSVERLNSAEYWSDFFSLDGEEFFLDKESLKDSCLLKIDEVKERLGYINIYFPLIPLNSINDGLTLAYEDYDVGEYELCLFKASKAKAEIDVIINAFSETADTFNDSIRRKERLVENLIAQEQDKSFPILGYSYLEYARSLYVDDPFSANLYLQYSLELSDIGLYLKNKNHQDLKDSVILFIESFYPLSIRDFILASLGILIGGTIVLVIFFYLSWKKNGNENVSEGQRTGFIKIKQKTKKFQ